MILLALKYELLVSVYWFPKSAFSFIAIVYMRFLYVINPQDGNLWCRARYNPNILICQILTQNEHPQCSLSIQALCPSLLDNFGWTEKCYLGVMFTMLVIWKCKKEFEWHFRNNCIYGYPRLDWKDMKHSCVILFFIFLKEKCFTSTFHSWKFRAST